MNQFKHQRAFVVQCAKLYGLSEVYFQYWQIRSFFKLTSLQKKDIEHDLLNFSWKGLWNNATQFPSLSLHLSVFFFFSAGPYLFLVTRHIRQLRHV